MFKKILSVRVQRIGDVYYPQYRRFFFWNYFHELVGWDSYSRIGFSNIENASEYVCKKQEEYFYPSCKG